jgi:2-C-methyl-D-erythritol 2,4-cyclodiphosphate synthase
MKIGLGKDIHSLHKGCKLVLGGVDIESDFGFDTHSDGDVLSHAIVDAICGALADGDLGTWFPEDDEKTQNAKSLNFIRDMANVIRERGYEINHLDSFIVLGTIKLRPYIDEIRNKVASALCTSIEKVSVKARSNDGLGLTGTGEACAAEAVILLNEIK